MRRLNYLVVLALSLASSCSPACAQDAAKLAQQYVKAAGGSRALSKIQTMTLEGTFSTTDGKSGTYTFNAKL
ncbi:MAG TPA: hypothetical protein VFM77_11440, partial [Terriglobales bacterium]|nr:hypothetical protein [Terriglobales bacterium]